MCLKILFPERVEELGLEDKWAEMKKVYEWDCQRGNWLRTAIQAMHLRILAAKEVRITDQGLELVMQEPETFHRDIPPRPVRREFN